MKFEYNFHKSQLNLKKHGISLEQAKQLWQVVSVELPARSLEEERFMIIGKLGGKCYSCIFTKRKGSFRLISARRSRKKEEVIYDECLKEKEH